MVKSTAGKSRFRAILEKVKGCFSLHITTATPKISIILQMLEPTTLPSAKPLWSAIVAWTDTNNSGALVPKATTVRPIKNSGTPSLRAPFDAPSMRKSAPLTKITMPTIIISKPINISMAALVGNARIECNGKEVSHRFDRCLCYKWSLSFYRDPLNKRNARDTERDGWAPCHHGKT